MIHHLGFKHVVILLEPSWSWSHGSWIYNYMCNQCLSPLTFRVRIMLKWGILYTTLCDKVCQWLATCRCFFPGPPVSSTNKTDRHDITEILVKVSLNTIPLIILFWLPCDYGCWNLTLNLIQLASQKYQGPQILIQGRWFHRSHFDTTEKIARSDAKHK